MSGAMTDAPLLPSKSKSVLNVCACEASTIPQNKTTKDAIFKYRVPVIKSPFDFCCPGTNQVRPIASGLRTSHTFMREEPENASHLLRGYGRQGRLPTANGDHYVCTNLACQRLQVFAYTCCERMFGADSG